MSNGNELNKKNRVSLFLNQQLANFNVLYVKLNNYHWFIEGNKFFELHEKFQEYYEEIAEYIDEIAERNLIIGGRPIGAMAQYLQHSTLKEDVDTSVSDMEMVRRVLSDFRKVVSELAEGIELAEDDKDHVTADLLIGYKGYFEKQIWQLDAFLK